MPTSPFLVAAILVAGTVSPNAAQEAGADATDPEALAPLLRELADAGFPIDPKGLRVETRPLPRCAEDIDAQQDAFFEPGHFPAMWVLYRGMGLELGPRPEDARAKICAALSSALVAYYDFRGDELVLVDSPTARLADRDTILVHELVHAWQDRAADLEALYRRGPRTLERTRVRQCLVEGVAEAVTLRILLERAGRTLAEATTDDTLAELTAGRAVSTLYAVGRRYALARLADEGQAWFAHALETLPPSTEQVIHPEKLGRDVPREVEGPAWPSGLAAAELVHEDTIGELGLFGLLSDAGASADEAWRTAIGWDGDRIRTWRAEDGAYVLAWSLVFDRPEDAEQFVGTWSRFHSGALRQAGRGVTWVFGASMPGGRPLDADDGRLAALLEAAGRVEPPAPDEGDAHTTAALEAALPGEPPEPAVADGRWSVPAFRLSLPAPEGWQSERISGRDYLLGPALHGFRDNLNVFATPNAASAADLLALNRRQLAESPDFELRDAELVEVNGADAVRMRYAGQAGGRALEFVCLILLRGDEQVVVTGTVLASRADTVLPTVEATLLGAELGD